MRRVVLFVICFLAANVFSPKDSHAILGVSPFGFMLKPYIGFDFHANTDFSGGMSSAENSHSAAGSILRGDNLGAHVGLRIHKYFGMELGYSQIGQDYGGSEFSSKNTSIDALLYYPLFSILGTAIEIYGGVGQMQLDMQFQGRGYTETAIKFAAGLQARLFGMTSLRVGVEQYDPKISGITNITIGKVSLSFYFL